MAARKPVPLTLWRVEVRRLTAAGQEKLFTTNYLARTQAEAEAMAVSNCRRDADACVLAHAKRSPTLERLQRQLYGTPGDERTQGPRRRAGQRRVRR